MSIEQAHMLRTRFYDIARKEYPNTGEPGTVWVLMNVLDWTWEDVCRTSVDGFGRESYKVYIKEDRQVVTRRWTKAEQSALKEWWWLLGL